MPQHYFTLIDIYKRRLLGEPVTWEEISGLSLDIAKEIDRLKVRGESTSDLERLHEEVIWLQCEVLKFNEYYESQTSIQ